jgi:predicted PurR-regulated permease PerM
LALFAVVAVVVVAVFWNARGALAPFAVGLVLAYILVPLVDRVQRAMPPFLRRARQSRLLAVLVVYVAAGAVLVMVAAAIVPPVVHQAGELVASLPEAVGRLQAAIDEAALTYERALGRVLGESSPEALGPVLKALSPDELLADATGALVQAVRSALQATFRALSGTVSWLLAFVNVPFWMVYLVNDNQRLLGGATALVPAGLKGDVIALATIADTVLAAYIRGQLIIALFLGSLAALTMALLGVPYALLLGVATGILGLIPFLGSILGALVAAVVALSVSGSLAVKAVLAYVIVQQVDNFLITPRTHAEAVALHPAVIMVVLSTAGALLGPVGLLVAVPVTAMARDVVHYSYLRLGASGVPPAAALATVGYEAPAALGAP